MTTIIFHHGWSFNRSFFYPLEKKLGKERKTIHCDAGYYSNEYYPTHIKGPVIGIGHSVGFAKLTEMNQIPWKALISISGFTKFSQNETTRQALIALSQDFKKSPKKVMTNLHHLCNVDFTPDFSFLNKEKSAQDLHSLLTLNIEDNLASLDIPVLALHGRLDKVVPMVQSKKDFRKYSFVSHQDAHHGLGFQNLDWCANHIHNFIQSVEK